MRTPLLSVVIPTYKRPHFLSRAIDSALTATANLNLEVLVIPNGRDESWKNVAEKYRNISVVKWYPLNEGNACKARNRGLELAIGKYIRFLDDDDYLYQTAAEQISLLEKNDLEFCSGDIDKISLNNRIIETTKLSFESDLISAAIASDGFTLPLSNVFLLKKAQRQRWRQNVTLYDDYYWTLDLVINQDWKWGHLNKPIGAYVQHFEPRLSFEKRTAENSMQRVTHIFSVKQSLESSNQLNDAQRKAISTAILTHAYSTFPSAPISLTLASFKAKKICSNAIPNQNIFKKYPFLSKNFLLFQWGMLPIRILTKGLRRAYWAMKAKKLINEFLVINFKRCKKCNSESA